MVSMLLLLTTCSDTLLRGDAFAFQNHDLLPLRPSQHRIRKAVSAPVTLELYASSDNNNEDTDGDIADSWSKAATKSRRSSPLEVRKRVRAVLEKARTRTGVRNGSVAASSSTTPVDTRKVQSIVAEAASIGGLGDGPADIVVQLAANATNVVSINSDISNGAAENRNGHSSSSPTTTTLTDEQLAIQRNGELDNCNGGTQRNELSSTFPSPENQAPPRSSIPPRKPREFDVIRGDVPAAAEFVEPLPFQLPKLTNEQKKQLANGERLQEQSRMGREGSGYVILDVKAPPFVVWETLLDFESYPETIPTVKSMQLYTSEKLNIGFVNEKPILPGTGRETRHYGTPSVTRAAFTLSKFRLNIAAIHRYTPHPLGDYMIFTLDPSCTNMVLKGAKGTWYTEENPDGREGYTRVYLLCEVQISRALPKFIVDYAADRAMPRATTWLRPEVEAAAIEWLEEQ
ncbi:hypothetical protein IV203_015353 [Nitzschia inconspicua]|uniref:Uncharacterized protein n=1 Tax=Nitzschia inconspicua TaxID=303405 RepID=A0A9K3LBP8_9STRA|nr:hypothetical protein IV203_015353 [Nitzschia inconspicua]